MTQRETVLRMLKRAGPEGVRSDAFFEAHLPRAAARILELKDAGYEISSEREGKFVRYRIVGIGAGTPRVLPATGGRREHPSTEEAACSPAPSVVSSEAVKRSVPSMFDADVEWD